MDDLHEDTIEKRNSIPYRKGRREKRASLKGAISGMAPLRKEAVITAQAYVRTYLAKKHYRDLLKMKKKRNLIVEEIINSEKAYVKYLTLVQKVFIAPLKESTLISKESLRVIFSEWEVIQAYNSSFLAQLENRFAEWSDSQRIGDIFLKIIKFLKIYTSYCNNMNKAMEELDRCKANKEFSTWLTERKPECESLDLGALLELEENTWKFHLDHPDIVESLNQMTEVARYVNEQKRNTESLNRMMELRTKLIGLEDFELVSPHRKLVREGLVWKITGDSSHPSACYLFLFNDILLWTKQKKHSYVVKKMNPLIHVQVRQSNDINNKPAFTVLTTQKRIVVCVSSQHECRSWVNDIAFEVAGAIGKFAEIDDQDKRASQEIRFPTLVTPRGSTEFSAAPVGTSRKKSKKRSEEERKAKEEFYLRNSWQLSDDTAELDAIQISTTAELFPSPLPIERFQFYSSTKLFAMKSECHHRTKVPKIVLIGFKGSGKSSVLESFLGHPIMLGASTNRPIYFTLLHNAQCSGIRITLKRDEVSNHDEDVTIDDPAALPAEIQKRNVSSFVPLRIIHESKDNMDLVFIDLPGLQQSGNQHSRFIQSVAEQMVRNPRRILLFVEEAKSSWTQMRCLKIATKLDPKLHRSVFVLTQANFILNNVVSPDVLDKLIAAGPKAPCFLTSLFSQHVLSQCVDTAVYRKRLYQSLCRDQQRLQTIFTNWNEEKHKQFARILGIHALRRHLMSVVFRMYLEELPGLFQKIRDARSRARRILDRAQEQLHYLQQPSSLRTLAKEYVSTFATIIKQLLGGSSEGQTEELGELLHEELARSNVKKWALSKETRAIPFANNRLYGVQQFQRLLSEFKLVVENMDMDSVTEEDKSAFCGILQPTDTLYSAMSIVQHKIRETFEPVIDELFIRALYILKRLPTIAKHVMNKRYRNRGSTGFDFNEFPFLQQRVKATFISILKQATQQCKDNCVDVILCCTQIYSIEFLAKDKLPSDDIPLEELCSVIFKQVCKYISKNVPLKCYERMIVGLQNELVGIHLQHLAMISESELEDLFELTATLHRLGQQQKVFEEKLNLLTQQETSFAAQFRASQ